MKNITHTHTTNLRKGGNKKFIRHVSFMTKKDSEILTGLIIGGVIGALIAGPEGAAIGAIIGGIIGGLGDETRGKG